MNQKPFLAMVRIQGLILLLYDGAGLVVTTMSEAEHGFVAIVLSAAMALSGLFSLVRPRAVLLPFMR